MDCFREKDPALYRRKSTSIDRCGGYLEDISNETAFDATSTDTDRNFGVNGVWKLSWPGVIYRVNQCILLRVRKEFDSENNSRHAVLHSFSCTKSLNIIFALFDLSLRCAGWCHRTASRLWIRSWRPTGLPLWMTTSHTLRSTQHDRPIPREKRMCMTKVLEAPVSRALCTDCSEYPVRFESSTIWVATKSWSSPNAVGF